MKHAELDDFGNDPLFVDDIYPIQLARKLARRERRRQRRRGPERNSDGSRHDEHGRDWFTD